MMNLNTLLIAFLTVTSFAFADPTVELIHSFDRIEYDLPADEQTAYIEEGLFERAPITGVKVAADGRIFVSTPRFLESRLPSTLNEVVTVDGRTLLRPFPSRELNKVGNPEALQSVLGFAIDSQNQMWILDMGYTASDEASLAGAQKLIVWDLNTNQEVRRIPITDDLASPTTSFLNDIALDEQNQMLYISDSGNRAGANVASGIIVIDLVTGFAKRVLDRHPTTANNPATPLTIEGTQVFPDNPLQVGVNGIALSPDGAELYWSVTTGDALYSIPTSVLHERDSSETEIEAAVETLAEGIGGTDGLAVDQAGNVYITALSQNALLRYSPASGEVETFVSSPEFIWPDTFGWGQEGWLYFTVNRLHTMFAGQMDFSEGAENFRIYRVQTRE